MFEYDYVESDRNRMRSFCEALNEMGKEGWRFKKMVFMDWETGYFCALIEREKEV